MTPQTPANGETADLESLTSTPKPAATTSFPTTLSDLSYHLPNTHHNGSSTIYSTLSALRKSTLSIPNRLKSVLQDAEFVEALHRFLDEHCQISPPATIPSSAEKGASTGGSGTSAWPLIPNERSGSWALHPALKLVSQGPCLTSSSPSSFPSTASSSDDITQPVSAYFKSTDGHINNWSFSTRRLNLPVLHILGSSSQAVLVDTTRRGKQYPDALRRTTPIWCCVWNNILFPELTNTRLCAFNGYNLDPSEIAQINSRVPGFVRDLKGLGLDFEELRRRLRRPVRCVWVSQPSTRSSWSTTFAQLIRDIDAERQHWKDVEGVQDVHILVCCSASKVVAGAEMSEQGYIQGAGDDSEGWSMGLTAALFWENERDLMRAVRDGGDLEDMVERIVAEAKLREGVGGNVLIRPTTNLFLAAGSHKEGKEAGNWALVVGCHTATSNADETVREAGGKVLGLGCKEGKLGSKMLREKLQLLKSHVGEVLRKDSSLKILVRCSTGKDLSVGVVLVILCCFYDDRGRFDLADGKIVDKQFVKQRLAWITSSKPDANPSRATLQAVNSFLMDRPD